MKKIIDPINDYENEFFNNKALAIINTVKNFNISEKIIKKAQDILDRYQSNYTEFGFTIFIDPRGAGRPRAGHFGQVYQPTKDRKYQEEVRLKIKEIMSLDEIISSEVEIDLMFYKPMPINTPKLKSLLSEFGIIRPLTIPDLDNMEKLILDAFNMHQTKKHGLLGLLSDDKLVVNLSSKKFYSSIPRIEVIIRIKENDNV